MAEHAGWARVASNWAIDRFAEAWFTGEDEDNEWLSDMDLRRQFNAVKKDVFPWSKAPIPERRQERHHPHRQGAGGLGRLQEGIEEGAASAPGRLPSVPQARPAHGLHTDQRAQHDPGGRQLGPHPGDRLGAHAGAAALRRGHPECHRQPGGRPLVHRLSGGHRRAGIAQAPPARPLASTWVSRCWPRCGTGTNGQKSSTRVPAGGLGRTATHRQGHQPVDQGPWQALDLPPSGSPVRSAETAVCSRLPSAQRPPPPDHHGDRQAWGNSEGGDSEHRRDAAQPGDWDAPSATPAWGSSCANWSTSVLGTGPPSRRWTAGTRPRRRAVRAEP